MIKVLSDRATAFHVASTWDAATFTDGQQTSPFLADPKGAQRRMAKLSG